MFHAYYHICNHINSNPGNTAISYISCKYNPKSEEYWIKKTAALFLVFALLLSLGGAAFAESHEASEGETLFLSEDVYADEDSGYALYAHDGGEINAKSSAKSSNSDSATVIASGEGSVVTVGINAIYDAKRGTAVSAEDGGTVTVRKEIRANGDGSCGISADNGTVTALGNVTARGYESEAIEATNGGTVTVKKEIEASFRENEIKVIGDRSKGISADNGTVTANGNVTVEGNDSKAVEAMNGSTVSVKGDVSSTPSEYYPLSILSTTCVDVQSGSTVSVEGNISAEGQRDTYGVKVNAGTATVTGNVEAFIMEETGYSEGAVFAKQGADVTVKGDVSATNCRGAFADLDSTVTVNGNVSIKSAVRNSQYPIFIPAAEGDTRSNLYITGNVESEGSGYISVYSSNGKVTVGGNVTAGAGCEAAVNAAFSAEVDVGGDVKGDVWAGYSSTVIVEGNAEGNVLADETSKIYLGRNDGAEVTEGKDRAYFLIGGVDSGNWENVSVSGSFALGGNGGEKITGVARDASGKAVLPDAEDTSGTKSYYSSVSMQDLEALCASSAAIEVVLSAEGSKVTGVPYGDAYKLVIDPAAASIHLSDLLVTLEQIITDHPEVSAAVSLIAENSLTVSVVEVTVAGLNEAVQAAEGSGVSPCSLNNHGGITVTAEMLGSAGIEGIKVFYKEQQLRSDDYTLYNNSDGSVSLLISNTYLMALGKGIYTFTAEINGLIISFVLSVE